MLNFGWIISRTSQDSNGKVSPVFSRRTTRELVELVSCWTWFRWDHHHLQTLRRKKSPPLGLLGMMGWWDWFLWVFVGFFPSFPKQSRDSRNGASIFEKSPKTTETNTGLSGLTCCSSKTLSDASEKKDQSNQGIVGCTLIPTWAPYGKSPYFSALQKTWLWKMGKKNPQFQSYPGSKQLIIIILTIGVHQCQFERSSTSIGGTFGGGGLEGSCTYLIYIYILYIYIIHVNMFTIVIYIHCFCYIFVVSMHSTFATKALQLKTILKPKQQTWETFWKGWVNSQLCTPISVWNHGHLYSELLEGQVSLPHYHPVKNCDHSNVSRTTSGEYVFASPKNKQTKTFYKLVVSTQFQ